MECQPWRQPKGGLMSEPSSNVQHLNHDVSFTIDGQPYTTRDRHQKAEAILRLAGLDPSLFDLGELQGARPQTKRYADDEQITVHPGARFVSIRQCADVA